MLRTHKMYFNCEQGVAVVTYTSRIKYPNSLKEHNVQKALNNIGAINPVFMREEIQ